MTRARVPFASLGKLLGHGLPETTKRYVHLADEAIGEAQAVLVARRVLAHATVGNNPASTRKRERQAPTFLRFLEEYWAKASPRWKPTTRPANKRHLRDQKRPALARCTEGPRSAPDDYNRFIRWSRLGVFNRIFTALAAKGGKALQSNVQGPDQLISDATT